MPTYRANALYQAPTVDNAVYEQFGMQPGMDRLNLLPRHDAKLGWIAPNALYQIARALVSPGVAAQGGNVSPEDAVNFAGNVSLGGIGTSALMKRPAPGPGRTVAQTVFHGSPHEFAPEPGHPLGRLRSDKIGTGEGSQAYGYGLYVAENPSVAKGYMTPNLYQPRYTVQINGQRLFGNSYPEKLALSEIDQAARTLGADSPSVFFRAKSMLSGKSPDVKEAKKIISSLEKKGASVTGAGAFYHVDLPDHHIANMLDWDKPLSQQPESVRRAWKQAQETIGPVSVDMTGEQAYAHMSRNLKAMGMGGDKAASELLRSLGVPGIRYLDGGSRGAGQGSRNFVVFDDKLLKVLKKE